jgi:hypothetical protein
MSELLNKMRSGDIGYTEIKRAAQALLKMIESMFASQQKQIDELRGRLDMWDKRMSVAHEPGLLQPPLAASLEQPAQDGSAENDPPVADDKAGGEGKRLNPVKTVSHKKKK